MHLLVSELDDSVVFWGNMYVQLFVHLARLVQSRSC